MDRDEQIAELYGKWKKALQDGNPLTPEELCRDCTELLPLFRETLPQLAAVDALFNEKEGDDISPEVLLTRIDTAGFRPLGFHKQGGLGVVLVGEDLELRRAVALKCMRPRAAAAPGARDRFIQEAEVTAKLEHPGIVPVYRMGRDAADRPYYAMRFVRGATLADEIDEFHHSRADDSPERNVAFRRLLRAFVVVCETMAYAHARGVIHRDLKPDNIMLGPYGETLVLDWGLAKRIDWPDAVKSADTAVEPLTLSAGSSPAASIAGKAKGAPAFMSPEQARGDWDRVGPPSDVYSLGSTLYSILTGKSPYSAPEVPDERKALAIVEKVKTGLFPPPGQVRSRVPKALEAICLKAMSVHPEDRYSGPRELAADVDRWLADEPVSAWREPFTVRTRRWLKRHRTAVTSAAAALLMALAGLGALTAQQADAIKTERRLTGQLDKQNKQLDIANKDLETTNKQLDSTNTQLTKSLATEEKARKNLEEVVYLDRIALADREWRGNNFTESNKLLDACIPESGRRDLRGWEWHFLKRRNRDTAGLTMHAPRPNLLSLAISSRGLLITGSRDGAVHAWTQGKEEGKLVPEALPHRHTGEVHCIAFNRSGTRLVSVARMRALFGPDRPISQVKVWDLSDVRIVEDIPQRDVNAAAVHPDGNRIGLACEDGKVRVWDLKGKKELRALQLHERENEGRAACIAFSPDGKRLAAGGWYGTIAVWDTDTWTLLCRGDKHHFTTHELAFSPDGEMVVSIGWDRAVKLWNARTGEDIRSFWGNPDQPKAVVFSPDGKFVASAGDDQILRVWNVETGEEVRTLRGHQSPLIALAFFPRSQILVGGEMLGGIRFWSIDSDQESRVLRGHRGHVFDTAFNNDGTRIATTGTDLQDLTIKVWDPRDGKLVQTFRGHEMPPSRVAFSPDGKWVASSSQGAKAIPDKRGKVIVWNAETAVIEHTLGAPGGGWALTFSHNGNLLAWAGMDATVHVFDMSKREEVLVLRDHRATVSVLGFSPDDKRLITASSRNNQSEVRIWDVKSGDLINKLQITSIGRYPSSLSKDCKRLVLIGGVAMDEAAVIWNLESGEVDTTLRGHAGPLRAAAFTPDGKRLATSSERGNTRLWDIASGRELLTLRHAVRPERVVFSPNGDFMAVAGGPLVQPGEVRIWDARTLEKGD